MIHFSLRCAAGHEFEAWFPSGDAFDRQRRRRQIACAECGSTKVTKAPMAPSIGGRARPVHARETRQALEALRSEVEKRCDYVGPAFAEEARKMHYGERDPRNIYGEASDDDAKALAEEGIEFTRIPWPKRADN